MITTPDCALVNALQPSPNLEPRRGTGHPDILLLHYTGMKSATKAIDWLARPEARVSCHYVIDEAGRITQMVPEIARAWHAGVAYWAGETDINSLSVGIEIHNPGHDDGYPDFPEVQMGRVAALSLDIVRRWQIRPERVLAHSDVAPRRKIDPGEKFDWQRLHRAGIGAWVRPEPVDSCDAGFAEGQVSGEVTVAQVLLQSYGYLVPVTGILDTETAIVLAAFQRHFRPERVDGRLDRSTLVTLEALVSATRPDVA